MTMQQTSSVSGKIGTWLRRMVVGAAMAVPVAAHAGVFVSVAVAPPVLPVYVQPLCPGEGYIWTPGYWAWGPAGYYWVPGVWVLAPRVGYLWTPPYWGWRGGAYLFHPGYWGPHVGFYGGVNYGFGYVGHGYLGGAWAGGVFRYNRSVNNLNVAVMHNTYVQNVTVANAGNRVSYNGGAGGVQERPLAAEQVAAREPHVQPTAVQMSHQTAASQDRAQWASANGGRPAMAAAKTPEAYQRVAARRGVNTAVAGNRAPSSAVQARPQVQAVRPQVQQVRPQVQAARPQVARPRVQAARPQAAAHPAPARNARR